MRAVLIVVDKIILTTLNLIKMEEIWKDVPNYEGIYQVSNIGNVKSLDRIKISRNKKIKIKGRVLKGRLSGNKNWEYFC